MIPLTGSFLLLLVLRFIQGFVLAGLPAASLAYLSEEIDKRSLSIAIPLYISSNAFGGMMGRVFTGYFTDLYSWEQSFYLLGIVGAVITLIVFLKLPKSRYFMPSNVTFTRDIEGFLFHLKNPSLLLVFGLGIVLQFSFTVLFPGTTVFSFFTVYLLSFFCLWIWNCRIIACGMVSTVPWLEEDAYCRGVHFVAGRALNA